jgi:hypothetical protein
MSGGTVVWFPLVAKNQRGDHCLVSGRWCGEAGWSLQGSSGVEGGGSDAPAVGAAKTIEESHHFACKTALGIAANRLDIEMIRLLLAWGASITAHDVDYYTARERLPPRTEENAEKWDLALKMLSPPE